MKPLDLDTELRRLFDLLLAHPEGLGEYQLLELLRGQPPLRGVSELELFRVHFLLFHHLYRLRGALEAGGHGTLDIHCLRIRLLPALARSRAGDSLPVAPDPLAEYYLDLNQLGRTTQEDVQELLRSFWRRVRVHGSHEESLAILGLGVKATQLEIRRRFRELTLLHHPDRGGDGREFSKVAEAMAVLRALGLASAA